MFRSGGVLCSPLSSIPIVEREKRSFASYRRFSVREESRRPSLPARPPISMCPDLFSISSREVDHLEDSQISTFLAPAAYSSPPVAQERL